MDYRQAIMQRLFQTQQQPQAQSPVGMVLSQGQQQGQGNPMDPRGLLGQFMRGSNVYNAGMPNAQNGGPNIGRPNLQQAASRRLGV